MVEIFQAGTRTDRLGRTHTITVDDLRQTVENYDPQLHQAPFLRLHNENQAAGGLVAALELRGDKLVAIPEKVDPEFAEEVRSGRYPRVSAAFYAPNAPNNPKPGIWYLRHVAFVPNPAVKGLAPPEFAADGESIEFMQVESLSLVLRNLREWLIDSQSLEIADRIIPDWVVQDLEREALTAQIASLENAINESSYYQEKPMDAPSTIPPQTPDLTEREAALAAREAAIAKKEAELRALEYAQFADHHLAKITPAYRGDVIEIMAALASSVEFSEDCGPLKKFQAFIASLPDRYSTKPAPSDSQVQDIAEFSEEQIAEMGRELIAIQQKHGVGPLEALKLYQRGVRDGSK